MTEQAVIAGIDDRFDWRRLRAKDPAALDVAAAKLTNLRGSLRLRRLWSNAKRWSPNSTNGIVRFLPRCGLRTCWMATASIPAWAPTHWHGSRLAAPSGHTGHRHEALRPRMVLQALVDQGVDETTAASVVG